MIKSPYTGYGDHDGVWRMMPDGDFGYYFDYFYYPYGCIITVHEPRQQRVARVLVWPRLRRPCQQFLRASDLAGHG